MRKRPQYRIAARAGALAGLRMFSAPAFIAKRRGTRNQSLIRALAVLEIIADKLPWTPARIRPMPLLARASTGALSAVWAVNESDQRKKRAFAALGAGAAITASFAGYSFRRFAVRKLRMNDFFVAAIEDAVVLEIGRRLC